MTELHRLTERAADALAEKVENGDISDYVRHQASECPNWSEILEIPAIDGAEDSLANKIHIPFTPPHEKNNCDIANSALVYRALSFLGVEQASDPYIWMHLSHFTLWKYVCKRWPLEGSDEQQIEIVRRHYLSSSHPRDLMRDNAIARLWWMGYIASCCSLGLERSLQTLLHQSDVRANFIERPSLARRPEIVDAVIRLLDESLSSDKALYMRKTFRSFMKFLSRAESDGLLDTSDRFVMYKRAKLILICVDGYREAVAEQQKAA